MTECRTNKYQPNWKKQEDEKKTKKATHHPANTWNAALSNVTFNEVQKYRYYWRIEPDVHFHCDVTRDPFVFMEEEGKVYGFTITMYEYEATIPTLWGHVKGSFVFPSAQLFWFRVGRTEYIFFLIAFVFPLNLRSRPHASDDSPRWFSTPDLWEHVPFPTAPSFAYVLIPPDHVVFAQSFPTSPSFAYILIHSQPALSLSNPSARTPVLSSVSYQCVRPRRLSHSLHPLPPFLPFSASLPYSAAYTSTSHRPLASLASHNETTRNMKQTSHKPTRNT
ncbi:hypothetical protein NMY22_g19126 [Coprinellus aureogranulatus]|nr:hypothetical protein NMY22_g19126 [Coprinellus aureogranulatus]